MRPLIRNWLLALVGLVACSRGAAIAQDGPAASVRAAPCLGIRRRRRSRRRAGGVAEPRPDDTQRAAAAQPAGQQRAVLARRPRIGRSARIGQQPSGRRARRADPAVHAVSRNAARPRAGEAWRQIRDGWIIPYGGALVVIVLLALALFYFAKGPIGGHRARHRPRRSSASPTSSAPPTGATRRRSSSWRCQGW